MDEIFKVAAAIIASIGGAGVIIFGLSSYLGRVWSERLMRKERHRFEEQLSKLKEELRRESEAQLSHLKTNHDIYKETHLKEHGEKIEIYQAAIDIMAELISKLQAVLVGNVSELSGEDLLRFDQERFRIYGYLGMFAPQEVMDATDALMDTILDVIYDKRSIQWIEVRNLALAFINSARHDVGINKNIITYRGRR